LHAPLPYGEKKYSFSVLELSKNVGKREFIHDDTIRNKIEKVFAEKGKRIGDVQKYLKANPIKDNQGNNILHAVFNIPERRYRKRQSIYRLANRGKGGITNEKQAITFINKIADRILRDDLICHLYSNNNDINKAFSPEGIEEFNSNRIIPVYKLPISEASSSKFPLGQKLDTKKKFGEAETGTNLFFAIYWNEEKQKREFETIRLPCPAIAGRLPSSRLP